MSCKIVRGATLEWPVCPDCKVVMNPQSPADKMFNPTGSVRTETRTEYYSSDGHVHMTFDDADRRNRSLLLVRAMDRALLRDSNIGEQEIHTICFSIAKCNPDLAILMTALINTMTETKQ